MTDLFKTKAIVKYVDQEELLKSLANIKWPGFPKFPDVGTLEFVALDFSTALRMEKFSAWVEGKEDTPV